MSKRLSDAPGYDKFVMSFADKIAKQLDAEKLAKEGKTVLVEFDKNETKKGDYNRKCPKCGDTCVGVILEDVTPGYGEGGHYWENMAVSCSNSNCNFIIQTRSPNP